MRSLTFALTLGCAVFACPAGLTAQARAPRTASFDTRYVSGTYSDEAWARFGIEALDLAAWPAQQVTLQGTGGNLLRGIALVVGTDFVARAYKISYHEYGHGTRAAAFGFKPWFGYGTAPTGAEIDDALASGTLHESFLGFFLGSFFQTSAYTYLPFDDLLFTPPDSAALAASGWTLIWKAGGLNNEMLITERVEDRLRRGGGHAGMLSSWIRGKISTIRYGGGRRVGDVEAILDWYRDQGYGIEREDLHKGAFVSLLASASTYELVYRLGRVLAGDPIQYEPWAPYGIELPNVGFYMMPDGLSYRVSAGYRHGRWRVPVAVERVVDGRQRTEVTLGGEWGPGPYYLGVHTTIGEQLGAQVSVDRRIGDRFFASGGYALYDTRNLRGERMIPSTESGPRYHDVFLRLGFVY